jgi:hypothetical protein
MYERSLTSTISAPGASVGATQRSTDTTMPPCHSIHALLVLLEVFAQANCPARTKSLLLLQPRVKHTAPSNDARVTHESLPDRQELS